MDAAMIERFRLARELKMTVGELNERMTVSELVCWREFFKVVDSA